MNDERANQPLDTDSSHTREDESTAQADEVEEHSTIQQAIGRLGIPVWALGVLVIALTVALVWAGDALIRSRQQPPAATVMPTPTTATTSTPTPAAAVLEEESQALILIADFEDRSDGKYQGPDPAAFIYEELVAQAEGLSFFDGGQVRIERLHQVMGENTARSAGQAYNAAYVLWGWYDAQGVAPRLQRAKTIPLHRPARGGQSLDLSEPDETVFCTLTDLPDQATYLTRFTLGVAALNQGETGIALEYLSNALAAAPEEGECPSALARAHLYLGNLHALNGEYEAALESYAAALASADVRELASDAAVAYTNRGSIRYALEQYEAALEDLDRALELARQDANAYYHRANVHRALEQQEAALADLDQALELGPEQARAYASRGLVHHNMGAYTAALEDYARALELEPDSAEVYLNRGGTYATLGNFDAALADYARSLELDPQDADAYYNRGTVHAMMENYEQALTDLDRALELKPEFAQVYGNRGLVYKALGETEKAIADLEHFLELSDNPQWRQVIEQHLDELQGN
jgi:tetratricopeptide (TPR) repeat protein